MSEEEMVGQEQLKEEQSPSTESAQTPTPPTPSQGQSIDTTSGASLELLSQIRALQDQVDNLTQKLSSPPQPTEIENIEPTEFLSNARREIDNIVAKRVTDSIRPLQEFVMEQKRAAAYNQLKSAVKRADSRLASIINDNEDTIDTLMSGQPVTPQALQAAILMALGSKNLYGNYTNKPTETAQSVSSGLPSSTPKPPTSSKTKPTSKINLTEEQRANMRILGIKSEEEFAHLLESGDNPDHWTLPEKK